MERRDFLTRIRNIGIAIASGSSAMELFDKSLISNEQIIKIITIDIENSNGIWYIDNFSDKANSIFEIYAKCPKAFYYKMNYSHV